jgi:hypothetical protein
MREWWEHVQEGLNGWSGFMAIIALASPWVSAAIVWAAGHANIAKYLIAAGCAVILSAPLFIAATTMVVHRMPWRGFHIVGSKRTYEFDDDDPSVQRASWERTIVLLNSATRVIDFRYGWTGRGTHDAPMVTEPANCAVLEVDSRDGHNHHLVFLGSGLPTRSEQTISLRQDFHDPDFSMQTFMGMATERRIGRLEQVVIFSRKKPPSETSLVYMVKNIRGGRCIDRQPLKLQHDADGRPFVSFSEPKARKGREYHLEWTWPGEAPGV